MSDALKIDIDISGWTLREQLAYREKVGVNPQFAYAEMIDAFFELKTENDAVNIPAEYLLGFVWVTQRRGEKPQTWDELLDAVKYEELLEAFIDALEPVVKAAAEDLDELKRPTRAGKGKKKTAPARTTPSSRSSES